MSGAQEHHPAAHDQAQADRIKGLVTQLNDEITEAYKMGLDVSVSFRRENYARATGQQPPRWPIPELVDVHVHKQL
jgi:hypothetical protein